MAASWLNLEGKTIIVTGRGLWNRLSDSQGIAERRSECRGFAIVILIKIELGEDHTKFTYLVADVTDRNSIDSLIQKVKKKYGAIDAIINNAGINIPRLLVDDNQQYELDESVWDKVMAVNVKGVFCVSQAAAHEMVRQGHGVIVNMSSECG